MDSRTHQGRAYACEEVPAARKPRRVSPEHRQIGRKTKQERTDGIKTREPQRSLANCRGQSWLSAGCNSAVLRFLPEMEKLQKNALERTGGRRERAKEPLKLRKSCFFFSSALLRTSRPLIICHYGATVATDTRTHTSTYIYI